MTAKLHTFQDFEIPEWLQIIGLIFTVAGVLIAIAGIIFQIRWSPRRTNQQPIRDKRLRTIRIWRPSHFGLALGYLQAHIEAMNKTQEEEEDTERTNDAAGDRPTRAANDMDVRDADRSRWTLQLALTAAAFIVPSTLGKSNFFRVLSAEDTNRGPRQIHIYSSEFVGVFSLSQLTEATQDTRLRDLSTTDRTDSQPVALTCVEKKAPWIESIKGHASSRPETEFGSTHILGIPIAPSLTSLRLRDQAVAITVDLRMGWIRSYYYSKRQISKTPIYRRALLISGMLSGLDFDHLDDRNKDE